MGLGPEPNLIKPWLGTWASQGLQRGWHRIFALNPDSLVSPAFLPLPDMVPSRCRISCSDGRSCPSHNRPPLCSCTDGKGYGNQGKKVWGDWPCLPAGDDHAPELSLHLLAPWWEMHIAGYTLDVLFGMLTLPPYHSLVQEYKVWNLTQFLKFGANFKYSLKM